MLLTGVLAGMTLASTAHAQIAYRSSASAFTTSGAPTTPAYRSASTGLLQTGPARFYIIPTNNPYNPTLRGNWRDGTGSPVKKKLSRNKVGSTSAGSATRTLNDINPGHVLVGQFVSDPLPTAQTISGTLNWVIASNQNNAALNAYSQLHVYVMRDTDTVVGTLLSNYAEGSPSGTKWPTTTAGVGPAGGTAKALTSVDAQAGDRIVVEWGFVDNNLTKDTGGLNYSGYGTDLAAGAAYTTGTSWFEFSQDLFGSSIPKPSGTVAGDVMIASISVTPYTATITPPAGWTLVRRVDNTTATTSSLAIYWRAADASDSSVYGYTWSVSGATNPVGTIESFSGADTANPIDVENGQQTASGTAQATPSVTTTGTNRLIVTSHEFAVGVSSFTGFPTGMTQSVLTASPYTAGITLSHFYVLQATAGATGTKTATSAASARGATHILALKGSSGAASNTLTINKPAGVAQNDVMIASIAVGPSTVTITPPAGWAPVRRTDNSSGTSNSLAVYSLLAGASEPANYSWTFSPSNTGAAGGIMAFSGADPVLETDSGVNTASGTSSATASVTTALAKTMIITSHGIGSASTWTPPGGMSETVDATGGSAALEMNYVLQGTAGPSGAKTATATVAGTGNAHIIALRRVLGNFNAFETTTAAGATGGVIKTKVAGSTVSLATISKNAASNAVATTFVGTVKIEVLNASDNSGALDAVTGCRSTWTLIQALSPDTTFAAADNGRKNISFSVPDAYRDVRLRMTSPPAGGPDVIIGCSSDNFAMRPNQFTSISFKDNDWVTANTSGPGRTLNNLSVPGGNVHKAGQPFTVSATAVNGAATPATTTNYTGSITGATLSACVGTACVASPSGTLTVGAGSVAAGVFTSHVATYSDVGAIAVTLVDSSFADVDLADSTAAEREIKSAAPTNWGRFVPDHFAVSLNAPKFATGCASGDFTYVGQPFNYSTFPGDVPPVITVTAQNSSNGTTAAYAGALMQITNASLTPGTQAARYSRFDALGGGATPALDPASLPATTADPTIGTFTAGVGTLTFSSGSTGLAFARVTAVRPFDADISLAINVIDADGVEYASNPARFGAATAGNGIAFTDGNALTPNDKQMRFGRLALRNANGSQLVPLPVQVEAQYAVTAGAGIVFITNKDDGCTSLANNNVQMSGFTANLAACQTAITGGGALSSGRIRLLLPPPGNANNGSVLLTANLSAAASGQACTAINSGTPIVPAAGADKTYLRGNWAGSATYADNPSARATFGTFKGSDEVIFIRENF